MAYATILTETRDRVRYVTLNRPEKRNALSLEFARIGREQGLKAALA